MKNETTNSGLYDLFNNGKVFNLVVDNARSHCTSSNFTADTVDLDDCSQSSMGSPQDFEGPPPLISVLETPTPMCFHDSFPPRRRVMTEEEESLYFGAWMSSSDSDIGYLFSSFDDMMRENTTNAMKNASPPKRRTSITESMTIEEDTQPPLRRAMLSLVIDLKSRAPLFSKGFRSAHRAG
eukprot:scaffold44155_cov176-Amphora_coffeaeformis.AAC.1